MIRILFHALLMSLFMAERRNAGGSTWAYAWDARAAIRGKPRRIRCAVVVIRARGRAHREANAVVGRIAPATVPAHQAAPRLL